MIVKGPDPVGAMPVMQSIRVKEEKLIAMGKEVR
jgi:hypothetical protein